MKLYRAFATVGGLTMLSRILGFIRDILLARVFGTGFVADAFVVAFRFPNPVSYTHLTLPTNREV